MSKVLSWRPRADLVAAGLLACALVAFIPNVNSYFLADDFVLLRWTWGGSIEDVWGFFIPSIEWFYRPVVKVVYWLGQGLVGLNPVPFHVFSLLLHGLNGYLVYRLVASRKGDGWVAGLAAGLLFLTNEHHAETVSWVAAVGDLLAATCILASLMLFRGFVEARNYLHLGGSVGLFALGLVSRENVVILPVLSLLYLVIYRGGRMAEGQAGRSRLWPGGLIITVAAYGLVLVAYGMLQAGRGIGPAPAQGGLPFRPLNLDSILLGILDYVHGLVPGGTLIAQLPLDVLRVLVWVEWAALIMVGLLLWRAGQRMVLFGLCWLLVTPLVFIFFSSPTDRYFYLPSIGYAILVGTVLARLPTLAARWRTSSTSRFVRPVAAVALGALLLWQSGGLVRRVEAWNLAGDMSGGFFADVRQAEPEPRDYSAYFFVGLPPFVDGVPVFQNSLPQAVQLMYQNETLAASAVTCEYLRQQAELPRYSLFFRLDGHGARRFGRVEECKD